jgi:hypothetical protein
MINGHGPKHCMIFYKNKNEKHLGKNKTAEAAVLLKGTQD